MRRRIRVDLGQGASKKEELTLERKRRRWAERNKEKPIDENPFLSAIRPDQNNYGDLDEKGDELKARLSNLEFGNFPGYYNYRNNIPPTKCSTSTNIKTNDEHQKQVPAACTESATDKVTSLETGFSDIRLSYFKKEWFHEKSVLDIGCNRGHITYAIAQKFLPKAIVGIDIDGKIISMANRDLHLHLEDNLIEAARSNRLKRALKLRVESVDDVGGNYVEDVNQFPLSSYISRGPLILDKDIATSKEVGEVESFTTTTTTKAGKEEENSNSDSYFCFPNNIIFVEHNYVLARDELIDKQRPFFDTIVCLSVTKWIHLNYRDDGLKRFFKRIYRHLREGGIFILEAQPFDNYERRRKLSDRLKANYYSIQFKPDEFDSYLLSEQVGFRRIVHESVTEHECAGFKRPLKVFLK